MIMNDWKDEAFRLGKAHMNMPDDDFSSPPTVEEYRDFRRRFLVWTDWTADSTGPYPDTWKDLADAARRLLGE